VCASRPAREAIRTDLAGRRVRAALPAPEAKTLRKPTISESMDISASVREGVLVPEVVRVNDHLKLSLTIANEVLPAAFIGQRFTPYTRRTISSQV
jgi:hypothetical protein